MSLHRRGLLLLALPAVLLAACDRGGERRPDPPAHAGTDADPTREAEVTGEEVRAHRLDMDEIRRWSAANIDLSRMARADPELARLMQEEVGPGETPMDRIERHPGAVEVLRNQGFSPRHFVVASVALMQAMMVAGAMDQRAEMEVPPEVNESNVRLVQENQAEIEQLFALMQAEAEQGAPPT
jgi:hypothetical protein